MYIEDVAYLVLLFCISSIVGEGAEWNPRYTFVSGKYMEEPRPYDTFRDQCTSIVVGRKARNSTGKVGHVGPMTSHSNDCADCEIRVAYVSAKNHTANSMRPVNDDVPHLYPRRVDYGRSKIYEPGPGEGLKPYLGRIPEASSTNALWESSYPLINEHGLAFGESTTEAKVILANAQIGHPDPRWNGTRNGTALFTISQLMQVALERCSSARCAIETISSLSETYGFAGEEFGTSETVTIIDKEEAWVFEITGGGPFEGVGDLGSLWVAQRLPEDHVAVVANYMIIRRVDPDDSDNFMVSTHLFERLKQLGLYDGPVAEFDWQRVMGGTLRNLQMYDLLRRWRVYSRIAPSLGLKPTKIVSEMPFSVKPDFAFSELDLMDLFRDHYEGTEFDMTKGVFAGPHGNPNYEVSSRDMLHVQGQIPRSISLMRTAYTSVVVSDEYPKVWFGVDSPATSVFVPFWAHANGSYSHRYATGKQNQFDRESALWAFNFVANYMGLNYRNMSLEYVYPLRDELQKIVMKTVQDTEMTVFENKVISPLKSHDNDDDDEHVLADVQTKLQELVVSKWWELADLLVMRYNDGYYNFPEWAPRSVKLIDFPIEYLREIGFNDDFIKPPSTSFVPFAGLLQDSIEWTRINGPLNINSRISSSSSFSFNLEYIFVLGFCGFLGFWLGSRFGSNRERAKYKKLAQSGDYHRFIPGQLQA